MNKQITCLQKGASSVLSEKHKVKIIAGILVIALLALCACAKAEPVGEMQNVKSTPKPVYEPVEEETAEPSETPELATDPAVAVPFSALEPKEALITENTASPVPVPTVTADPTVATDPTPTPTQVAGIAVEDDLSWAGGATSYRIEEKAAVAVATVAPGGASFAPPSVDTSNGYFGTFSAQTIDGNTFTNDEFGQKTVTLVNVMATWCGPCVNEMPALQSVSQDMADQGVAVVGIITDTNSRGQVDQHAVDTAKQLQSRAGVTYPLLIPDETQFNGALSNVQAYPTTYFIGSDGQQLADPVVGGKDYNGWVSAVQEVLASL